VKERREIALRWREGLASVLITLVRVKGSSYRQPGAHLLLCNDGSFVGSVSGGCLERDVLRKALWLVRNGPKVETYSTLFDEMAEIPFGLGCGGVLDLLLEPVNTPECEALFHSFEAAQAGCKHAVATWLPETNSGMARAIFDAAGEAKFVSPGLARDSLLRAQAVSWETGGAIPGDLYWEHVLPPQRLFVFGAGEDAKPLVSMATHLGWKITVLDGRAHLTGQDRFPGARVELASPASTALHGIDTRDAVVLMTHSYELDRQYLTALLPRRPRYLGLLGSRRRSSLLIAEIASRIEWTIAECCECISAPVGLELGGEGPEAIALAILAQAQAVCMGKRIDARRLEAEYVQSCVAEGGFQKFLQTGCGLDVA
jgi:xanthine dehydrogenase accessory factor